MKISALRFFSFLLVPVSLFVVGTYVDRWDLFYDSDIALMGLVTKGIAFDSQHPIFLGDLGYHGVFLEGYLGALYFRFFGANPTVGSFAPATYFLSFIALFYFFVRRAFTKEVALAGAFLLVVSSPWIYYLNVRMMLLVEVLFLGIIILWIYPLWFESFRKSRTSLDTLLKISSLGFFCGFALYHFRVSAFFILAISTHSFFSWLLTLGSTERNELFKKALFLYPGTLRLSYFWKLLLALGSISFLLGFSAFMFNWETVPGTKTRINAVNTMAVPVLLWIVLFSVRSCIPALLTARGTVKNLILFASLWFVGYFPSFYYYSILKGPGGRGIALRGTLSSFLQKLFFAFQTHLNYFNFSNNQPLSWFALLIVIPSLSIFLIYHFNEIMRFLRSQQDAKKFELDPWVYPIFFLPFFCLLGFVISSRVLDVHGGRNILPIIVFHAVAIPWGITKIANHFRQPWMVLVLVGIVLANNARAIYSNIRHDGKSDHFQGIVEHLKSRDISFGIGSYWFAYCTTFLSEGDVHLEPYDRRYLPAQMARVESSEKIAIVDYPTMDHGAVGEIKSVENTRFRISEIYDSKKGFKVWELVRIF